MGLTKKIVSNYVLLVILVAAQQTTEPPPDEDERSVNEICQFVIQKDKQLVEKYKARPRGEGEEMMKLAREYNDNLAIIVKRAISQQVRNETKTVIKEAKALIDHGGPEFINFYVERSVLEKEYGLNNITSRILLSQRQNAIDIWEDFYKLYSVIPDEDGLSLDYSKVV